MSKIEQRHIDIKHDQFFPFTFTDKKNETFRAKSDALLPNTYIELKEHPLNHKTSKQSADNKILSQHFHRFGYDAPNANAAERALYFSGHNHDCLLHAWHHSAYKHQIISKKLKSEGIRYIIVFSSHPPEIEYRGKMIPFKRYYKERFNLETMLEHEFNKLKQESILH